MSFFFFFQAEDGIRYLTVTGVQTCALPIWARPLQSMRRKLVAAQDVFPQHADRLAARAAQPEALGWTPLLRRFTGAHPDAAQSWIAPRRAASAGWGRGARQLRLWPLRAFGVGLGEGPTR